MLLLHLVNELDLHLLLLVLIWFVLFGHLFFHVDLSKAKSSLVLGKLVCGVEGVDDGLLIYN